MKHSLFMAVLFLLIVCFSGSLAFAEDPTNAPKVFDQALMNSLLNQGYEWNDLIQASILAHHYKVPLQSLLDLRPVGTTWEQIEVALVEMDYARTMLLDKTQLKEDHVIAWLVKKGFTDEEIALLAYNASLLGEPLTRAAGKAMQELDQRGGKREKRIDFGFTTSAETMTLSSTLTSTVTYDDPGLGYDVQKCSPFNRLMQSRNEVINPASGFLQVTETDLVLPGKNGLDFSLTRVYQSEKSEMSKYGVQYALGNVVNQAYTATVHCIQDPEHTIPAGTAVDEQNRVMVRVASHMYSNVAHIPIITYVPAKNNLVLSTDTGTNNYADSLYHLGIGWSWNLPSIENLAGSKQYLHLGNGIAYKIIRSEGIFILSGVENNEYQLKEYTGGKVTNARYLLTHQSGTNYYFDQSGRVLSVDQYPQASGTTYYRTSYTYNLADQVISMTDPRQVTLKYEYDIFGLTKVDYPGTLRADDVYVYEFPNSKKQVKQQISGATVATTEYDELDRVKKVTDADGRVMMNYYDPAGRLSRSVVTSSRQNTEIAYEYDVTGNVSKATHLYDGRQFIVGYEYDEKGNVTKIIYPSGYAVSYEYDLYDRVVSIPQFVESLTTPSSDPGDGGGITYPKPVPGDPIIDDPDPIDITMMSFAPLSTTLPGVRYKANGFMEAIRYANGVTTVFTDDSLGRLGTIKNPVFELTYGYDGKGNVTSITGKNGVTVASSYQYYDNDWLKGATQGQNVYAYVYDKAGNCTTKTINGVSTTYTYDPLSLNLLTAVNGKAITHDAGGSMIERADTGYKYEYDKSNQLTNVIKNGLSVGKYCYNSEGKRYKKVENSSSTYYVYSGEMLLYELQSDGKAVHYIYLNGKQIAKMEKSNDGDKKSFYHTDHLGSTRAITDEVGNVVGRFEYQPFGLEESSTTGNDTLTFTGKMKYNPTGLMYFNARYYDPTLGRFLTEDPAKDGGNWYVYCANNPVFCFLRGAILKHCKQQQIGIKRPHSYAIECGLFNVFNISHKFCLRLE